MERLVKKYNYRGCVLRNTDFRLTSLDYLCNVVQMETLYLLSNSDPWAIARPSLLSVICAMIHMFFGKVLGITFILYSLRLE